MKLSDYDFCAVCKRRKQCPHKAEEPAYTGTLCLAWQPDGRKPPEVHK